MVNTTTTQEAACLLYAKITMGLSHFLCIPEETFFFFFFHFSTFFGYKMMCMSSNPKLKSSY